MQNKVIDNSFTALTISELNEIAVKILADFPDKKVFAFYGEMGAGKTTLIKALCKALNVIDATSSPTFSIVNEYKSSDGKIIYHFDFYRIKTEAEAFDIGYEEYLYSGNYCFVEWPEKISDLMPHDAVKVRIEVQNLKRHITVSL